MKTTNLMKKIILLILLSILCKNSFSQGITWGKILNFTNGSTLFKAQQTSDGGYIAVGEDRIGIYYKIFTIKFNEYGDSLWSRYYDLKVKATYRGFWIEETNDKGFIVSGSGEGPNTDAYLIKLDTLGMIQWVKIFSTFDLDQGRCVKELPDKGFILLRRTDPVPYQHIELTRIDSMGKTIWSKIYGDHDRGSEVEYIVNSGFIVSGWRWESDTAKLHLVRTDLNGDTIWTKTFYQFHKSLGYSIDVTEDKGFIIGGVADTSDNLLNKAYIIKTDSLGKIQWQRRYANGYNETCYSIRKYKNTGYVFCGFSDSIQFINRGVVRIIDLFGNVLHEKYFRISGQDNRFYSVELTNDNGLILSGSSATFNNAFGLLVKTDSTGNIYPVGIRNSDLILKDFKLHQNHPNPFNPTTTISFDLPQNEFVILKVYDISGREIMTLVHGRKSAGYHIVEVNGSGLSSGVYLYEISAGEFKMVRKMVLIK